MGSRRRRNPSGPLTVSLDEPIRAAVTRKLAIANVARAEVGLGPISFSALVRALLLRAATEPIATSATVAELTAPSETEAA